MKIKELAIKTSATLILIIIALVPFHAFLTVWGNSLIGHYTLLRLWKEYLLAICFILTLYIFFTDKKIREIFYYSRLVQLIIVFFVIELAWGVIAKDHHNVSTKALFYGWLSDTRYLIFFLITLIIAKKVSLLKNKSIKLVLWPATVVILFGLLEVFVLPRNFLTHFGYGPHTIMPYQTINSNKHYVRILSTLRGSDPLGAYLLIPLSLAAVLLIRKRKVWQNIIFLIGGAIVMFFSFSRSAWLGLAVALALSVYWGLKSKVIKRRLLYIAVVLAVVLVGGFIAERNNTRIQNIVFHTQNNSAVATTSDQNHLTALKDSFKQLATEPLGKGPGTAGPASVYNKDLPARIPENYYLQIGLETGWLGMLVFLAINILVAFSLWVRRRDALSLALLTSFIGLFICNMLLESWTDDTLSYLWWGLAGIAIAVQPRSYKTPEKKSFWIT